MRHTPICFDLDGVLYDFMGSMLYQLSLRGHVLSREAMTSGDLSQCLQENAWVDCSKLLKDARMFYDIRATEGLLGSLRILARDNPLYVVTSRPQGLDQVTMLAVERDFPGIFTRIFHTRNKLSVIHALKSRHHVEDHTGICEKLAENRIHAYLIKTPYTGSYKRNRFIHLCNSTKEAIASISSCLL